MPCASFKVIKFGILLTYTETASRYGGQSSGDEWRSAFDGTSNAAQSGYAGSRSRRTPSRMPPAPPVSGYKS